MNIYQLLVNYIDGVGNQMTNVLHYALTQGGSFSPFDYAVHLVNQFQIDNEGAFQACLGNDARITSYTAKKINSGGGPSAFLPSIVNGTFGSNCEPAAVAANIAWQTADPSNRPGHTLLGGIPLGAFVNAQWDPIVYVPNVLLLAGAINTPLTLAGGAGDAQFVIYNRKLNLGYGPSSYQLLPKPTGINKRTKPNH